MIKGIYTLLLSILLLTFAVEANARFIQPDWWDVSNPQVGTNPYAYSHNNPINLSDRNGNIPYNPGGDTSTGWNDNGDGSEDYCSCTDRGSSDYSGGFALDDLVGKTASGETTTVVEQVLSMGFPEAYITMILRARTLWARCMVWV